MGRHRRRRNHKPRRPTWGSLLSEGKLASRHVLMAEELGLTPDRIQEEFAHTRTGEDELLLEWVEDRYFERHGRYFPMDETANPEAQAEDPAETSLLGDPTEVMNDYLLRTCIVPGSDDEPMEWYGEAGELIEENERTTPVSVGELREEDRRMLLRQDGFRKAASLLARNLSEFPEVQKVLLFGSVALPLWKEVPRWSRLRSRRIKVFHECANIDLAVWTNSTANADQMRRSSSRVVTDLVENEVHLSIAHHLFCIHLVDMATQRYLGMVCHYNQCPKKKEPCRVPGCGARKFVQILPWFHFKPHRLNSYNSQVLFERKPGHAE